MVDIENHIYSDCRRSRYDSNCKPIYYSERSRSYRVSLCDDYRYEESHNTYLSQRNSHRYRSRSKNYDRSDSYSRSFRRNRNSHTEQTELNYPKSRNITRERSRSPTYINHVQRRNYSKIRKPLFDVSENTEFEITNRSNMNNSEYFNSKYIIIDEFPKRTSIHVDRMTIKNDLFSIKSKNLTYEFPNRKSLLGDGPKVNRMQSIPYNNSNEDLTGMCLETINLMNSQYCNHGYMQQKKCEIDPQSPLSGNLSDSEVSKAFNYIETKNIIQIIDYNHTNLLDISLEVNDVNNYSELDIKEENSSLVSIDSTNKQSNDDENSLDNIQNLSDQIKNLANLLTQNETKEVIVEWRLIPLFAPLRTKITEKDIDVNLCSEYDPRISHIVRKQDCI